jgi:hypothetical protein
MFPSARVAFALMLMVSTAALAQSDAAREAFDNGTAAFESEQYARALEHYLSARELGIDGPAVSYNIAVSYYRLGDLDNATREFSLIADTYPSFRELAQYNLGLIAQRQNEAAAADDYFSQALQNTQNEVIRRLANRQLRPGSSEQAGRWFGLLDLRYGHDDNVRLLSDDEPLANSISADSNTTELTAFVSGPLSDDQGLRFDGTFYFSRFGDASFFDQNYIRLGLSYQWTAGNWRIDAGPHLSQSTLDGDGYEDRTGAGIRFRKSLSPQLTLSFRFLHDNVDAGSARFLFVDGDRDWAEMRLDRSVESGSLTFLVSTESNDRGITIASNRQKIGLGYRHDFSPDWSADFEGRYSQSSYDDLATPRDEDLTELSIGATRILSNNWTVNALITTASNDAIAPYSYDRNRFSFGLAKSFY